jgi:predicted phage terminase large subunit-like protein
LKLTQTTDQRYLIEDVVRIRQTNTDVRDQIVATAKSDGFAVAISLPIDPGQAGLAQVSYLSSLLSGYRIYSSREQGTKYARATPVAVQIANGTFHLRPGPWTREFLSELTAFPHGENDDQVDALSRAFSALTQMAQESRRLHLPYFSR